MNDVTQTALNVFLPVVVGPRVCVCDVGLFLPAAELIVLSSVMEKLKQVEAVRLPSGLFD